MGSWLKLKHGILIAAFAVSLALYFGALPAGFYNSWRTERSVPLPNSGLGPYLDGLFASENPADYEKGVEQYRTSMLIVGMRSPQVEEKLGDKLSESNHHEAALQQYEQALAQAEALERDHPGLHLKYSESLWRNGRGEEAYLHLQETIERWQEDPRAWMVAGLPSPLREETLGDKLTLFEHHAEALAQYKQALQLAQDSPSEEAGLHLKYAQSLWNNGSHERAYEYVQETANRWEDDPRPWYMLATMDQHAGNYDSAIQHCRQSLQINPGYSQAQQLLEQLPAAGGQ